MILINKKAFTLAEILITLSIIGVIASMTIPSLVQDIQDAQLKTAWKKVFADFNQSSKLVAKDFGGSFKRIVTTNNNDGFRNLYLSYLNYTKICNQADYVSCWSPNGPSSGGQDGYGDNSAIVLNNGVIILLDYSYPNCDHTHESITGICADAAFDVNGIKGPNKLGKDIFGAYIMKNHIIPIGRNSYSCDKNGGIGCSAKYLYE